VARTVQNKDVGNIDKFTYEAVKGQVDLVLPIKMKVDFEGDTLESVFFETWRHRVIGEPNEDGSERAASFICRDNDPNCYGCQEAKTNPRVSPSEPGNGFTATVVVALYVIGSKNVREDSFHPVGYCAVYSFKGKKKRKPLSKILEAQAAQGKKPYFCIEGEGNQWKDVTFSSPAVSDAEIKSLVEKVKDKIAASFTEMKQSKAFERALLPPSNAELKQVINRFLRRDDSTDFNTNDMVDDIKPDGGDEFGTGDEEKKSDALDTATSSDDPFGVGG